MTTVHTYSTPRGHYAACYLKARYECGPYASRDEALAELAAMVEQVTGERVEFDQVCEVAAPELPPSVLGGVRQLRLGI